MLGQRRLWLLLSRSDQVHGPPVKRARPSSRRRRTGMVAGKRVMVHFDAMTLPDDSAVPPPRQRDRSGRRSREDARLPRRDDATMLLIVRSAYILLLVVAALLPYVAEISDATPRNVGFGDHWIAFIVTFLFGVSVLAADALTPNKKKLNAVFGVYLGVVAGLIGAYALGTIIDLIGESWDLTSGPGRTFLALAKMIIGLTLCYLAVSFVLTTKDDFRLVIPYVEFAKEVRGVRPLLLDTSALIDGRIEAVARSGFLDAPLVVPQCVIEELQRLADSSDRMKRARGRRGLDLLSQLQGNPAIDISLDSRDPEEEDAPVDRQLLQFADANRMRLLTTDFNLIKIARIRGLTVLNLNDLASAMRPPVQSGEEVEVLITRRGEEPDQGVGHFPDGTMVVVEGAANAIGQPIRLIVTNALQTSAGRMIFGRRIATGAESPEQPSASESGAASSIARAAVTQPRTPSRAPDPSDPNDAGGSADRGDRGDRPPRASRRNPRRD